MAYDLLGKNFVPPDVHGKVTGKEFTWTVKRDRPDSSIITYNMTGKLEGDTISAKATTKLDGNDAMSEWTAKRK